MNRVSFGKAMLLLGVAFDSEVTETRIQLYYDALKDMPEENVLSAMRRMIRESVYFPKIAELRSMVTQELRAGAVQRHSEYLLARDRAWREEWEQDRLENPPKKELPE